MRQERDSVFPKNVRLTNIYLLSRNELISGWMEMYLLLLILVVCFG